MGLSFQRLFKLNTFASNDAVQNYAAEAAAPTPLTLTLVGIVASRLAEALASTGVLYVATDE